MSAEFKWFRDTATGRVAQYPARFGDRFATLEEIDESEAYCFDCLVPSEPDTDAYPDDLLSEEEQVEARWVDEPVEYDDPTDTETEDEN